MRLNPFRRIVEVFAQSKDQMLSSEKQSVPGHLACLTQDLHVYKLVES